MFERFNVQVFKYSSIPSIQVLKYSGIQVFKCSSIQEYQAEVKMQGKIHKCLNNGRRQNYNVYFTTDIKVIFNTVQKKSFLVVYLQI